MSAFIDYALKIDEAFQRVIPPLSLDEQEWLEMSIRQNGCREPLHVWNQIILDGHHRYAICTRLKIPFEIMHVSFEYREKALSWICANHLVQRVLAKETRHYLIGKRCALEKIINAHDMAKPIQNRVTCLQNQSDDETRFEKTLTDIYRQLCHEYHICQTTLNTYRRYAYIIDMLMETAPELASKILSGRVKISHRNMASLSRQHFFDFQCTDMSLSEMLNGMMNPSAMRAVYPKKKSSRPVLPFVSEGSIKDMPAYDPDAEILSLCLTIPSWINIIERALSATDFTTLSGHTCHTLNEELSRLQSAIESIRPPIKENPNENAK